MQPTSHYEYGAVVDEGGALAVGVPGHEHGGPPRLPVKDLAGPGVPTVVARQRPVEAARGSVEPVGEEPGLDAVHPVEPLPLLVVVHVAVEGPVAAHHEFPADKGGVDALRADEGSERARVQGLAGDVGVVKVDHAHLVDAVPVLDHHEQGVAS